MVRWFRPADGDAAEMSGVDMSRASESTRERVDGPVESAFKPRFDEREFFGQQPTSTASLPDPRPLLENLTRCVVEILAGARELEQIARWVESKLSLKP